MASKKSTDPKDNIKQMPAPKGIIKVYAIKRCQANSGGGYNKTYEPDNGQTKFDIAEEAFSAANHRAVNDKVQKRLMDAHNERMTEIATKQARVRAATNALGAQALSSAP